MTIKNTVNVLQYNTHKWSPKTLVFYYWLLVINMLKHCSPLFCVSYAKYSKINLEYLILNTLCASINKYWYKILAHKGMRLLNTNNNNVIVISILNTKYSEYFRYYPTLLRM